MTANIAMDAKMVAALRPSGTGAASASTGWRLWGIVRFWMARRRQRAELERLDARMLDDIGVTRAEALREAVNPFWR